MTTRSSVAAEAAFDAVYVTMQLCTCAAAKSAVMPFLQSWTQSWRCQSADAKRAVVSVKPSPALARPPGGVQLRLQQRSASSRDVSTVHLRSAGGIGGAAADFCLDDIVAISQRHTQYAVLNTHTHKALEATLSCDTCSSSPEGVRVQAALHSAGWHRQCRS